MKRFAALLLSAVMMLTSAACASYPEYTDPEEAAYIREAMRYVIHGGGTLDGIDESFVARTYDGSNSKEGLEQCIAAGCEVVELDFSFTSDGELACIHNWAREYSADIENGVPLTLDEFLATEIYANFTPMWLGDVADALRENEGLYIVLDIKDELLPALEKIADTCPDLKNRFIVQIYDKSEYDGVRSLGFEYVVFTLYRLGWAEKTDWKKLGRFAKNHPLIGYTFSHELCQDAVGYLDGMLTIDVPLYVHTVDGEEAQQYYFDLGITGIYTDDVK
ncbi:MAG: hypothetical protein IJ497_00830 [Clostridia bacterium]|nr:hypothetical protein [Clostridia bacterium]MBQ8511131.1 hypothetical protein [Clostridia bacterium]